MLCELDNVTARFEQRAGRRRDLRISVTPFFGSELLVPHLRAFAERHRAIDIRVETAEPGTQQATGCDASILLLHEQPTDMLAQPLFTLRLAPACSPQLAKDRALTEPRALIGPTLIVHKGRPNAWRDWFANMDVALEHAARTIELDSMFAVARAAQRGLGVALLPVELSQDWFASGTLVQPCRGELRTSDRYYFVYRRDAAHNPDVAALRDWVTAMFALDERSAAVAARPP